MEWKLCITKPSILCTSCSGHYRQWYRNEEKWLHWSSSSNFSGCTKVLCPFHSSTKVSSPAINLIPRSTLVSKWIYIYGALLGKCHKALHALNRNVFNKRLNCSRLWHCLRLIGSEFHSRGPEAAKCGTWHRSLCPLIKVGERGRRRQADSPPAGDQVPDQSSTGIPVLNFLMTCSVEHLLPVIRRKC